MTLRIPNSWAAQPRPAQPADATPSNPPLTKAEKRRRGKLALQEKRAFHRFAKEAEKHPNAFRHESKQALADRIDQYVTISNARIRQLEHETNKAQRRHNELDDAFAIEPVLPYARRFCVHSGRELTPHSNETLLRLVRIHGNEKATRILQTLHSNDGAPEWMEQSPEALRELRIQRPCELIMFVLHRVMRARAGWDKWRGFTWEEALVRNQALLHMEASMNVRSDNTPHTSLTELAIWPELAHSGNRTLSQQIIELAELARMTLALVSPHTYKGYLAEYADETTIHTALLTDIHKTLTTIKHSLYRVCHRVLTDAAHDLANNMKVSKEAKRILAAIRTPNTVAHAQEKHKGSTRFALSGDRKEMSASKAWFMDAISGLDFGQDSRGQGVSWMTSIDMEDFERDRRKRAAEKQRVYRAKQRKAEEHKQRNVPPVYIPQGDV